MKTNNIPFFLLSSALLLQQALAQSPQEDGFTPATYDDLEEEPFILSIGVVFEEAEFDEEEFEREQELAKEAFEKDPISFLQEEVMVMEEQIMELEFLEAISLS